MKCFDFSAFLVFLFGNCLSICVIKTLTLALDQKEVLAWVEINQIIKYVIWNDSKEDFNPIIKKISISQYTQNPEH